MTTISISNVVNVTITETPQGLMVPNVNSLALFTTEQPNNIDPYNIYLSSSAVANDYGSNSVAAAMTNAIFAQTPNILSGDGQLVIIPLEHDSAGGAPTSATAGTLTTANLSSTLTNIVMVNNGQVKITVDSVDYSIFNLNFTAAQTWADIAAILGANLPVATVTAISNGFEIISKKVGTSSTVAMSAATGAGTDLNGVAYFKGANATTQGGTNATGETLEDAILRTQNQVFYCGVMTDLDMQDALIETTAAFIQSQSMIYLQHFASLQDIAGIAHTITEASETQTRPLLYTESMATANLMKAAYAGRGFSTNFSGINTASTMNLKRLATIVPDAEINQTNYENLKLDGMDAYINYSGYPGVLSTGVNDYFDNVYANMALKFALEVAGFNYLATTNTKIPQTESGMNGLKNAYAQVLQQFVNNGTIAPGAWTASDTFGDPAIFKQNIANSGYYIYSIPISQQDPVQRAERRAPLVQIAIKRAGAIHSSDVIVIINA